MKSALIKLHIAVLLAGFTAVFGKIISLNEALLVWWRLLITAIVMLAIMWMSKHKPAYPLKSKLGVLGVGIFVGLHWLCFFGSVKYSNITIAVVCLSTSGFFSALLEPLIRRTKFKPVDLLLGALCIAGIYIIFHFDTQYKTGILLGILAALLSAVFSILNKKMVTQIDGLTITTYEMLGALILMSCIIPFYAAPLATSFLPVGWDWLWLCILAVVCTVWAFILQLQALKHVSAFTLNLSYNLEPIYGIILAFVFFKENKELSSQFYIGVLLILLSIGLQMWRVWKGRKR
ncbi:MAG: DMT family transporter [Bacteroidota bacterium]